MKVELIKNNRYWDPKTETHLTRTSNEREFTEEEMEELDMSNIEYAVEVGILETDSEEFGNEEEEEIEEVEEETEEEDLNNCQAKTSSGEQCSNTAVWPEEDPEYCHIEAHKKNHENYEELASVKEEEEEIVDFEEKENDFTF